MEQQPYDPAWPTRYEAARSELAPIFGADAMIEHIGSTSIPGCSGQGHAGWHARPAVRIVELL